ncbi:MAG TPA: hypothetical protein VNE82_03465 [Candidatus Binataceae bacterium]|nr:hypothetical protein [Candidatus Binataceae bacterium]
MIPAPLAPMLDGDVSMALREGLGALHGADREAEHVGDLFNP